MRLGLGVVALVALVASVWLASRGLVVARAVQDAQQDVRAAQAAFAAHDLQGGAEHVRHARDAARAAQRASSDPVWAVAATAPVVGDDLAAVAAVVAAVSDVVSAAEPLTTAAADAALDPAVDPAVDLVADPVAETGTADADGGGEAEVTLVQVAQTVAADPRTTPQLQQLHEQVLAAQAVTQEVSGWSLLAPVARRVGDLADLLEQARPPSETAVHLSGVLPALLGDEKPSRLLVGVQTPSEVRSLGGLVGLVLLVQVHDGEVEVVDSYAGSSLPPATGPVDLGPAAADLDPWHHLFSDRSSRFLVNATMVPDGPTAAALLLAAHERRGGPVPDAVVLTDLQVLTSVLAVTGPVALPDGTSLDAATSRDFLQYGVYEAEPDPAEQDLLFEAAARGVLDATRGPDVDDVALLRALGRAADEGLLMLWSPEPPVQEHLAALGVTGTLLADPAVTGVFLNDATSAKMQHFLRQDLTVEPARDGTPARLVLDLVSTVEDPDGLPDYVAGSYADLGLPRGAQRVQVLVVGAVGGGPAQWRVDGEPAAAGLGDVAGRRAGVLDVDVLPGARVRLEVDLDGAAGGAPAVVTTPTVVVAPNV